MGWVGVILATEGTGDMTSMNETAASTYEPLSMKAACIGFLASTAMMTLFMTLVGNLH